MKKRNWLMTIAFAVLSLTIISTCVIGSTYAKFVSKVGGNGSVQAAGFMLTDGGALNFKDTKVIGPDGGSGDTAATIKYYSQVATILTFAEDAEDAEGTNAFTTANWTALRSFYNDNFDAIATYFGYGTAAEGKVDGGTTANGTALTGAKLGGTEALSARGLIKVSSGEGTIQSQFKTALVGAGLTVTEDGKALKVTAMGADVADVVSVTVTSNIKWTTLTYDTSKANNLFDTYVGYIVAQLQLTENAVGNVDVLTLGEKKLTLAKTDAGKSTMQLSIGITAEQDTTIGA